MGRYTNIALIVFLIALAGCGGNGETVSERKAILKTAEETSSISEELSKPVRSAPMQEASFFSETRVVDEDQAARGGPDKYWVWRYGYGVNSDMLTTLPNRHNILNWVQWKSGWGPGRYRAEAFIPRKFAMTRNARYRIQSLSGSGSQELAVVAVNQYDIYDAWANLGEYTFGGEPAVLLGDDTGEASLASRAIGFDAVRFTKLDSGQTGITVPIFSQKDSKWANLLMRPSALKMKDYGCLVTAISSVSVWGGYATDPGVYCNWLSANGGFTKTGLYTSDAKLGQYTGNRVVGTGKTAWTTIPADLERIARELDERRPVVLEVRWKKSDAVRYQHFVVAVGYSRNQGKVSDFKVMDPILEPGGSLVSIQKYNWTNNLPRWIYSARWFRKN